jgi:hypothetical protein
VVLGGVLGAAGRVVAHLHVGEAEGFVEVVGEFENVADSVVLKCAVEGDLN